MLLFLTIALLGGCSPHASGGAELAARVARGGLCSTGPCLDELRISDDGRWERRDEGGVVASGRLRPSERATLRSAAERSEEPRDPTPVPGCGAAGDGQDVEYAWVVDGVRRTAGGCATELPPVATELDALADRLR